MLEQGDYTCTLLIDGHPTPLSQIQTHGLLTSCRAIALFTDKSSWLITWTDKGDSAAIPRVYFGGEAIQVTAGLKVKGTFDPAPGGVATIRLCLRVPPPVTTSAFASPRSTRNPIPVYPDSPSEDHQIFFFTIISTQPANLFPSILNPVEIPLPETGTPAKGKGKGRKSVGTGGSASKDGSASKAKGKGRAKGTPNH